MVSFNAGLGATLIMMFEEQQQHGRVGSMYKCDLSVNNLNVLTCLNVGLFLKSPQNIAEVYFTAA